MTKEEILRNGYTKQPRTEIGGQIWQKNPMYYRVWEVIKSQATWKEEMFPTSHQFCIALLPGDMITSLDKLAEAVKYFENKQWVRPSRKTILAILQWLQGNRVIDLLSNNTGTFIRVCNYSAFNGNETEPGNRPGNRPGTHLKNKDKRITENKEKKEKDSLPTNPLAKHIRENFPQVARMDQQPTNEQYQALIGEYDRQYIKEYLNKMENYKPLARKNRSVIRTMRAWMEKDKIPKLNDKPRLAQ